MTYRVKTTPDFERDARRLKRKYRSLREELDAVISELEERPNMGIPIGHSCYKIRLAIKSKGRGKSSGGRLITHVHVSKETVFLLSIYDKSDRDSISDAEVLKLLDEIE